MHVIAAKAVAFGEALAPAFGRYAHEVVENARTLAGSLAEAGFHPVSGGTDTHLLLVDLRPSHPDLTGSRAERVLEAAGITANKNTVPNETRSPFVASGLRIGTAAATTRGMTEPRCVRSRPGSPKLWPDPRTNPSPAGYAARFTSSARTFRSRSGDRRGVLIRQPNAVDSTA